MSAICLTASPQRPYIHEIYGPELKISWPDGQKLHEEAMEHYYTGDYTTAVQKLDKAITDAEQFSKAKEKDTAILVTTKAEEVMLLGDTEEANTLLLRAQQLADRVLASNHPVTERIQADRALVLFARGNPAEAKVALERAIATQAGRSGTNDVTHARSLNHKALICLAQGDPAQASVLIGQSSQIIEKVVGTQSPLYGQNELLKSLIAAAKGEYEKAVRLCESSLTTLTNCFGPEHLILVSVRKALADDYQQLGMYEQAASLLQGNLQTLEKTIASDNIVLSGVLNSLGLLHYHLGNNSDAEQLLRRCLSIQEKSLGVSSPGYAATVNNLALVLDEAGKHDDVSTLFKYASTALNKSSGMNSPALATVWLNWGIFSRRIGNLDNAKSFLGEAFAIRDKAFGKNHPAIAEAAEAYGQLQCDLGDFKYADQLASLAFSIKTNFYRIDHPAMADSFSLAARIHEGLGDKHRATEFYAKSAGIRAKTFGAEHPTVSSELEAAGLVLCRAGDHDEAVRPLLTALRSQKDYLVEQVSRANGEDGLRLAGITFYRTELFHSLCALSFFNAAASVPAKAAEQLASCKSLLEEVQATRASLELDARTSTRELRENLAAIQNQLARLPEINLDPAQRAARRRQLQSNKAQIEEALAERNGLVAQTIRERNLTLTDIARSLPPQAVLVDFVQYRRYDFAARTNQWKEHRYAAYLTFPLARDSTNVVVERVDLGEAAPINEAVELICKRMSAGQFAAKDLPAALQRVSELVYGPLAQHLTNVSHLIVCPDGQLSRLPFEMLRVGDKFLIEDKTISYVTSGREVARLGTPLTRPAATLSPSDGARAGKGGVGKSLVMGAQDSTQRTLVSAFFLLQSICL